MFSPVFVHRGLEVEGVPCSGWGKGHALTIPQLGLAQHDKNGGPLSVLSRHVNGEEAVLFLITVNRLELTFFAISGR